MLWDVGANVGQTVRELRRAFPDATIWAFEPGEEAFGACSVVAARHRAEAMQLALADEPGSSTLLHVGPTTNFRLSGLAEDAIAAGSELVEVTTVDLLMQREDVRSIHYLKIDTEGGDLLVLKGAQAALASHRVDFIQVEVGMHDENTDHVTLQGVTSFLAKFEYRLFGIYDQMWEFKLDKPWLRRVNAVFVSPKMVRGHGTS
jgi:FkbM family methyltransferase